MSDQIPTNPSQTPPVTGYAPTAPIPHGGPAPSPSPAGSIAVTIMLAVAILGVLAIDVADSTTGTRVPLYAMVILGNNGIFCIIAGLIVTGMGLPRVGAWSALIGATSQTVLWHFQSKDSFAPGIAWFSIVFLLGLLIAASVLAAATGRGPGVAPVMFDLSATFVVVAATQIVGTIITVIHGYMGFPLWGLSSSDVDYGVELTFVAAYLLFPALVGASAIAALQGWSVLYACATTASALVMGAQSLAVLPSYIAYVWDSYPVTAGVYSALRVLEVVIWVSLAACAWAPSARAWVERRRR